MSVLIGKDAEWLEHFWMLLLEHRENMNMLDIVSLGNRQSDVQGSCNLVYCHVSPALESELIQQTSVQARNVPK